MPHIRIKPAQFLRRLTRRPIPSYIGWLTICHFFILPNHCAWAFDAAELLAQPHHNVKYLAALAPTIDSKLMQPADVAMIDKTKIRTRLISGAYLVSMAAYGYNAWWKNATSEFHLNNEGWFGQDTSSGGADKLGHAYTTYLSTRLVTGAFNWAGHDRQRSRRLAGTLVGATTLGIEILDGFTDKFGFSLEDLTMDVAGIALGVVLDSDAELDALFDFRLQYWPSSDAKRLQENDPVEDYSGQIYLFITKANGIPALKRHKVLRYLELALGYGTTGYKPSDGTQTKERHLYYGISINLAQLLDDTLFRRHKTPTKTQRFTRGTLEYLQLRGTAALAREQL